MSLPNPIVLLDARASYVHPAFQMSRASTKTVFDSTGKLVTVPVNAIGWDHDPATWQARGYLAEPSATNLLLYSNDLTQTWVVVNATTDPGAIIGPDGSGMAKLIEDNQDNEHFISQDVTIGAGDPVSFQCIARADERDHVVLQIADVNDFNNFVRVFFNLSQGEVAREWVAEQAVLLGRGIRHIGNGFYHCWISGTLDAATACQPRVWLADSDGARFYQGDGTSGLHLGYLQTEIATHPTSYVPTGGASAARSSETLRLPNVDQMPWWSSVRGTVIADITLTAWLGFAKLLELGTAVHIRAATFVARTTIVANDFNIVPDNPTFVGPDDYHKRHIYAIAWDEDGISVAVDGEIKATGDRQSTTAITSLGLMTSASGVIQTAYGHIHRAVYYPARLSNADLQSLTAIQE